MVKLITNLNVLSQRYATDQMNGIFQEYEKNLLERELWLTVMKSQKELGVDIPSEDIEKYERSFGSLDLNRIAEIEAKRRHDIKAKIEHYVEVSGAGEHIHKGMTSRDLTDNIELIQNRQAARIIFGKYVAILDKFIRRADEYKPIILTARTHHQPAQPTLLGRRFSMWAEELLLHLPEFETFIENMPFRGIKGAVGSQFDQVTLLGGYDKAEKLDRMVADHFGFKRLLDSPGQVYPRSLDYSLANKLAQLTSSCENFAKGMRLMSGYELVTEGFKDGQVGSTAMPHKMNTRSSERICGSSELVKMYADGASRISGDQWEEGDVSCSIVRRVIDPDIFYASEAVCETTLTVLREMGAYPVVIDKELDRYLPFLATTEILMTAVKKGMGREEAHKIIKKYAVEEALKMREEGEDPWLVQKLALDPLFMEYDIQKTDLEKILQDKQHFIGNTYRQMDRVKAKAVSLMLDRHGDVAVYQGKDIL